MGAGLAVEVAGGLVGEDQLGLRHEGARHGDALLLAAGELGRIVAEPMVESHRLERRAGAFERVRPSRQFQRHGDVLQRRHGGDEMEGLEHDADAAAAEKGQRILVHPVQIGAVNKDRAGTRPFQSGDDHDHGGLAGARRSADADTFAALDTQVYPAQDLDLAGGALQIEMDAVELDHRHGGVPGRFRCRRGHEST